MSTYIVKDGTLYHHGIKGQKWGERRYQYENGALTPEGRIRYGFMGIRENMRKARNSNLSYNSKRASLEVRKTKNNMKVIKDIFTKKTSLKSGSQKIELNREKFKNKIKKIDRERRKTGSVKGQFAMSGLAFASGAASYTVGKLLEKNMNSVGKALAASILQGAGIGSMYVGTLGGYTGISDYYKNKKEK